MRKTIIALLCVILVSSAVFAQPSGKKFMTMRESLLLPSWGSYNWSPDGSMIAFTKSVKNEEDFSSVNHIWIYDVSTAESWQLTNSHRGESGIQWLPDGRILFSSSRDGSSKRYVISLKGGEAVPFYEDEKAPSGGSFSDDFKKVAYTKRTERPDKKEWDEKVENKDDAYYHEQKLTWSHIWVYDIDSKEHKQITTGEFDNSGATWSPDSRWIAFTSNRSPEVWREDNNSDIWIVSSDSGAVRQLTTNEGPDRGPVFSPDGKTIAYTSSPRRNHRADQSEIMIISFEGGTPQSLTDDFDYSVSGATWSPDGQYIYFTAGPAPSSYMYRVSVSGGTIEKISPENDFVYGGFRMTEDGTKWLFTGSKYNETGEVFTSDINFRNIKNILSPTNHMGEFELAKEEVLYWKGADDWEINGILTYPIGYEPGKKYPMILMVHGGPFGQYRKSFSSSTHIWASRGYAVLRGNPRGSSGHTLEFGMGNYKDWGGKDRIDLLNGVDHVVGMGVADPEKLTIMGGSYGGFMTFWMITQTTRFKAAIGHAAISDWFSFFGQTDIPQLLEFGFGGFPWQTKEVYEKYSPIEYIDKITTPLLITHGEQDFRVNLQQGDQYYRSLMMMGKTVEFLRFPREGHGIREPLHRLYLDQEQEKWFEKYIFPDKYEERMKTEAGEKAKKK
ncbi:prolyl oligopeptidase family serine peptidase [candidate division KSB1 bacterium]